MSGREHLGSRTDRVPLLLLLSFPSDHVCFPGLISLRREDLRIKHALTRLQNFYKDVRTSENNSTWPRRKDAAGGQAASSLLLGSLLLGSGRVGAEPAGVGAGGAGEGMQGEAELVEVAFFSDSQQIKTPKPQRASLPSIPAMTSATPRQPSPPPQLQLPPRMQQAAATEAAPQGSAGPQGAAKLSVDDPSAILEAVRTMGRREALRFVSVRLPALISSPKQQQGMLQPIEPRDEFEQVIRWTDRLPALRCQSSE